MAFTVKATYNNQTRKFAFADSAVFPSYEELHQQLFRVFNHGQSYYLSRMIFCPSQGQHQQLLIGMEIHTKEQYDAAVAPHRKRAWPGALLKVTVCDVMRHKPKSTPSLRSVASTGSSSTQRVEDIVIPRFGAGAIHVPLPPFPVPSMSMGAIPPPPIIFSSSSRHNSAPMDVDGPPPGFVPDVPQPQAPAPCCSVSKGKDEVKTLLSSFLVDFDRIATSSFGTLKAEPESAAPNSSVSSEAFWINGGHQEASPETNTSIPSVATSSTGVEDQQTPPSDASTIIHRGVICDGCRKTIVGVRHKCMTCHDYDLCDTCLGNSVIITSHGEGHRFFDIPTPNTAVHRGVVCDVCELTIVGVRHKCLDCADFDICSACIATAGLERVGHNPFHEFFDIEEPGRVIVHTVFSGDGENEAQGQTRGHGHGHGHGHSHPHRREHGNRRRRGDHSPVVSPVDVSSVNSEATVSVPVAQPVPAIPPTAIIHGACCNLCDSAIRGDRYKCLVCPDFDACAGCFSITPEQHPDHGFVKITKPEDVVLRKTHSLRVGRRHWAFCNACSKTITGVRYKCMHPSCSDFDLCDNCEALPIPTHPSTHPMLKIRDPETVIPTVYRVGGTIVIPQAQIPESNTSMIVEVSPNVEPEVAPVPVPSRLPTPVPVTPMPGMPEMMEMRGLAFESGSKQTMPTVFTPPTFGAFRTPVVESPFSQSPQSQGQELEPEAARSELSNSSSEQSTIPQVMLNLGVGDLYRDLSSEFTHLLQPTVWNVPSSQIGYEVKEQGSLIDFDQDSTYLGRVPPMSTETASTSSNTRAFTEDSITTPSVSAPSTLGQPTFDEAFSGVAATAEITPSPIGKEPLLSTPAGPLHTHSDPSEALKRLHENLQVNSSASYDERDPFESAMERLRLLQEEKDAHPERFHALGSFPAFQAAREDGPLGEAPSPALQGVRDDGPLDNALKRIQDGFDMIRAMSGDESTKEASLSSDDVPMPGSLPVEPAQSLPVVFTPAVSTPSRSPSPVPVVAPAAAPLLAFVVTHRNIPDGQIFPPGAEFVKSWVMRNGGETDWPESTELKFIAGECLAAEASMRVGKVLAGSTVDISAPEMKASETPGRYVGYWKLSDGKGNDFGQTVWVDITVVAPTQEDSSSEGSLAASSVIMPHTAPAPSSVSAPAVAVPALSSGPASTVTMSEDAMSDDSSISLIDGPDSDSDDDAMWEDTRSHNTPPADMEYVVLYEESSSSEGE